MSEEATKEKEPTEIDRLQKDWDFVHSQEELPGGFMVHKLEFLDGRAYKFQEPEFFAIHEEIQEHGDLYVAAMRLGLKNLHPLNEQSPRIDEEYLRRKKNRAEGLGLWAKFFTEVLFREAEE